MTADSQDERIAEYAAGRRAAEAAIATLARTLTDSEMYRLSTIAIIKVEHAHLYGPYQHGQSCAWVDWQASRRLARRRSR